MSTPVVEVPVEVSLSTPDGAVIKLWEQIVPSSLGHIRATDQKSPDRATDTPLAGRALKQLIEKKNYWGFP